MSECPFTYEQMKEAGWADEHLLANPDYAHLVPKKTIPTPPGPPGPPPVPPKSKEQIIDPPPFIESEPLLDATEIANILEGATPDEIMEVPSETSVPLDNQNTSTTFTPQVKKENIIGNITPANFDNMMKVLNVISKENPTDNITIRDSIVRQGTPSYVIVADMTKALGQSLNLDIISSSRYVKLFSQFRTENNVFIIDDEDNKRFVVTNGEVRLFLPKQEQATAQDVSDINTVGSTAVCSKMIDKETRKIIKGLAKDQEFIEYLIQDNTLKAMHIPNTAIFVFNEFLNDEKTSKLDETSAELVLRTNSFLPVEADGYDIQILKLADEHYGVITNCKIGGQIDVKIMELCDNTTGGNVLL